MAGQIPPDAVRVQPEPLRELAGEILRRLDVPAADAGCIAGYLVQVDLRGVFSHGTRRLQSYVNQYRAGELNPRPEIRVVRDEATVAVLDGDGGLGYLVATRATAMLIAKTEVHGLAIVGTRYHGHVGSAGIYARMALEKSLLSFAVAGGRDWRAPTDPGVTVWDAMRSPPMCFGIPAAAGPPLVLDMSANFFRDRDRLEEAMLKFPESVFKSLGLKFVSSLLGGILAGSLPAAEPRPEYAAASRGFLMLALRPDMVGDAEHFQAEVARIIAASRALAPVPGQESAEVAGSLEWQRERDWVLEGIPLGADHRRQLEDLAAEIGVAVPW